jgi:hypothetical protein
MHDERFNQLLLSTLLCMATVGAGAVKSQVAWCSWMPALNRVKQGKPPSKLTWL